MLAPRRLFPILVAASVALLAYSSLRAFRLSFVHDESLSFTIASGLPQWKNTANHHPLNTLFMGWTLRRLGTREWQLRLPNVLAHAVYLGCGLVLLRQLAHGAPMLLGFALLNLNPFLLDFFSLARGYGLALGFSMAALLLLWRAWRHPDWRARAALVASACACASLADAAVYAWLNFHLPLLAAGLLLVVCDPQPLRVRASPPRLGAAVLLLAANAWVFHRVARQVLALKAAGELYGRGTVGFLHDCLGSLVEVSFYRRPYGEAARWAVVGVAVAAFVVALVAMARRTWTSRTVSFAALVLLALVLAVAAPIAEHALLGTEYPNDRVALYYVPLGGLAGLFAADEILRSARHSARLALRAACLVGAATLAAHFASTANLHYTRIWFYDQNTKAAMAEIARRFGGASGPVRIGNSWFFEPTINYYRVSRGYDWLAPATRDRLQSADNDVVYCLAVEARDAHRYDVLQSYPETASVLLAARR